MFRFLKYLRTIISPVADVLGILSFLGIGISAIDFRKLPPYVYIILAVSLPLLTKIVLQRTQQMIEQYKDMKVAEDLENIDLQKDIQNISLVLPKTDTLMRLYEKVQKKIQNWADDAQLKSVAVYFDYTKNSWQKPILQLIAFSPWKNEEGWFYEGRLRDGHFEEGGLHHGGQDVLSRDIFFMANGKWRESVIKAYNSVSGKVSSECYISIQDKTVTVSYKEGLTEKKKRFRFNEGFNEICKM